MKTFLQTRKSKYTSIDNIALAWDTLKCEIRGITIEYAIKKAKKLKQYVNDLNAELKILETKLDNNEDVKEIYDTIHKEQIEEEKLRGNIIRSRAQWIEEGEKYFMQLETKNYETKCMTTLIKYESKITDQNANFERVQRNL